MSWAAAAGSRYLSVTTGVDSKGPESTEVRTGLSWRPGLDGLRGIAIVAVLIFHFKTKPYLPGGGFGVDLFFVLSGFLITTLLLEEWNATGGISLRRFYARRALRLLPAAIAFILVYAAIVLAFNDQSFTGQPGTSRTLTYVGYALTYSFNWPIALGYSAPPGFSHLWSLSVEEQYYLLWPALLLLILRSGIKPRAVLLLTLLAIASSSALPFVLREATWERIYYGSDFRAHELLVGSLLAQLYVFGYLRVESLSKPPFRLALGTAAVVFLLIALVMSDRFLVMYRGGFVVLVVSCAILVLGAAFVEDGIVARLLRSPILTYLGRRSYALYLWHMPIGYWLRGLDTLPHLLIAGGLSIAAAELSFRLVERPALRLKERFASQRAPAQGGPGLTAAAVADAPAAAVEPRRAA
jgi:peptidoglycan/LPS O-acetylase OafA/YrhL